MSAESTVVKAPSSATDRVKKIFEGRDWKFYCALAAGITLAGAGVLYYSSSSSQSKSSKKRDSKKKQPETKREPTQSNTDPAVDYEQLSSDEIAALSNETRAEVANVLKTKGNELFAAQKYDQAIKMYSKALEFKKDHVYFSNRAACHASLGHHDQVIEDCKAAIELNPLYIKPLNRLAQALEKEGQLEDSLYYFTCIWILEGFRNETATKAMERLLKKVSEEKAKRLMETKTPRLPSSTFVSAYLDSFRPDKSMHVATGEGSRSGDALFAEACAALENKDYDACVETCEKAEAAGCSPEYEARLYNLLGTFVFLKGMAKEALEYFNKSAAADSKYVQSYIKRSSIYMEQGDLGSTFEQFEQAIAINPNDPDIYYHRGQVNYISGKFDAAAKDYRKSIDLDRAFVYAHIQLGVVQYKLGAISDAMDTFAKTLEEFPTSAEVRNYFGELLADQQKIAEAIDMFDKAVELDSKNPLPYINKAMLVYQLRGDTNEAVTLCKAALEADPACDAAVASLAQILLEQDKPDEALTYYEKAIDLARTATELEHALSYVEATKTQIRFAKEYPEEAKKLKKATPA